MNMIPAISSATMTSRQIAEAVGSDHHNVLATVRRLIKEGVISGNETPYIHEQNGQQYTEFNLTYRDTMVVTSGYSTELRARVIDRWLELERGKSAFRLPQTFAEALRLAAEQAERIERQAADLAIAAPKVAFAEAVRALDGVCKIGDFGKTIGIGRTKIFRRLRVDKILMKNNLPYQKYVDKGYFTVVENKPYTNSEGETHPYLYNHADRCRSGVLVAQILNHRRGEDGVMELYWIAMYVSQIWYAGYEFKDRNYHPRYHNYCRTRAVILFDRVIAGRANVNVTEKK